MTLERRRPAGTTLGVGDLAGGFTPDLLVEVEAMADLDRGTHL